mmetsp:Transcript_7393/g.16374  ORF Transcript_7393/g.16374 Transcript_7393/m.16374 type:complete len:303 (+) Transcript_7393:84-992(+)
MMVHLLRPSARALFSVPHIATATRSISILPSYCVQLSQHRQQSGEAVSSRGNNNCLQSHQRRTYASKSPGSDPLELLRKSSENRQLCDEFGLRKKDVHWTFGISTSGDTLEGPPQLRTIDFQRVTPSGIDFVRKRGKGAASLTSSGKAASILCSFGKYRVGEKLEQWVAEGQCEQINLVGEGVEEGDLLKVIPSRSVVELVASMIVKEEDGKALEDDHTSMDKESHYMEVVQKTRNRLESGELTNEEIDRSVVAVRFVPYRMERYIGGPDQVMWERWEWKKASGECPEGTSLWNEPKRLLPY